MEPEPRSGPTSHPHGWTSGAGLPWGSPPKPFPAASRNPGCGWDSKSLLKQGKTGRKDLCEPEPAVPRAGEWFQSRNHPCVKALVPTQGLLTALGVGFVKVVMTWLLLPDLQSPGPPALARRTWKRQVPAKVFWFCRRMGSTTALTKRIQLCTPTL